MKSNKILVLLFICFSFISELSLASSEVDNNKVGSTLKIGVVTTTDIENCLYGKEMNKKLEKEFGSRKNKFDEKQKELQNKGELLQRDRAILSEKERIAKERELIRLQQDLQHLSETLDTEMKSRYQEELTAFNKVIDNVVSKVAAKENYDLILPDRIVMFNSDSLDCTSKIVAELDAQFKAKK